MKVLLVHTYYQLQGGEDTVFEQERSLLEKNCEVKILTFNNLPGICGALQFFISIWNPLAINRIRKEIKEFKPDLVHIHNWHFACGPGVIRAIKHLKVPVVMTLHNYRLLCPSATLEHSGKIFTSSLSEGFPWEAVKKKVFRSSYLQTFWLAFIVWFHKKIGTWGLVDKYIVLTQFAKDIFLESTLKINDNQIVVKPNFTFPPQVQTHEREDSYLFVGRLMEEKGIRILLETFKKKQSAQLIVAGAGPMHDHVLEASYTFPNIKYLGSLSKEQVNTEMQKSSALIFPSIWFEGMPMTIIEAFSLGTPVICSNLGAMAYMIKDGVNGMHFEAGNVDSLSKTIDIWKLQVSEHKRYSDQAKLSYNQEYTPEKNIKVLLKIYSSML